MEKGGTVCLKGLVRDQEDHWFRVELLEWVLPGWLILGAVVMGLKGECVPVLRG